MSPARCLLLALTLAAALPTRPGLQLCGAKLADLLTLVCRQRGGFHGHRQPRAVPLLRPLHALMRRSAPDRGRLSNSLEGVADECCHKSCTVAVLASYCAQSGTQPIPLDGHQADAPAMPEVEPVVEPTESSPQAAEEPAAGSLRPNLGVFSRTRPYIIVFNHALHSEEESDANPLYGTV